MGDEDGDDVKGYMRSSEDVRRGFGSGVESIRVTVCEAMPAARDIDDFLQKRAKAKIGTVV